MSVQKGAPEKVTVCTVCGQEMYPNLRGLGVNREIVMMCVDNPNHREYLLCDHGKMLKERRSRKQQSKNKIFWSCYKPYFENPCKRENKNGQKIWLWEEDILKNFESEKQIRMCQDINARRQETEISNVKSIDLCRKKKNLLETESSSSECSRIKLPEISTSTDESYLSKSPSDCLSINERSSNIAKQNFYSSYFLSYFIEPPKPSDPVTTEEKNNLLKKLAMVLHDSQIESASSNPIIGIMPFMEQMNPR